MPLRKIYDFVQSAGARFTDDVRHDDDVRVRLGSDDEFSLRYDSTDDVVVLRDEPNSTDVIRVPAGSTLPAELASSGATPISEGALNAQDPTAHAAEHKDGGADELDAAQLAGGLGTNGEFLKTDGSSATWAEAGSSTQASTTNDGSDVVRYRVDAGFNNPTLVNRNSGGLLVGGMAGARFDVTATLTVDGGPSYTLNGVSYDDSDGSDQSVVTLPTVLASSSLTIKLDGQDNIGGYALVVV